ncbi:MAG: HAD-IB family phosphatase [Verrucomicrobia bacterium]|nr:HAD-IB family phosphatase [Verrucomicrobiota bacterium]
MSLVLFDFDDTVTMLDSTLLLGVFVARKRAARHRILLLVAALLLARFRLVSNTGLKRVFAGLVGGQTASQLQLLAREFYDDWLNTIADDEILDALRMHVLNGDRVFLVSANFDWLLEPLADRWSLAGVIATQTEYRAGVCTGGIIGTACHGTEKLRRVVDHFGEATLEQAIAYGNKDDAPLLEAVQTGYLIRRTKPSFPMGLLRRYSHVLSGKLSQAELLAAPKIDLLPTSRCSVKTVIT